ncbi:MAG: TolC family protein [Planctomycetes bacterium]|nr:TolC family protein [Planctomycetota bacterium]
MNKNFIICLALIASCSSPQSQVHDPIIDGQQFATADKAQLDPWWHDLNSSGLNQYVEMVLDNNFDLAAAAANLQSVAATTSAVIGQQLPALDLGLNFGKSRTNMIGLPIPGAGDVIAIESDRASLDLNLSWELDFFGRLAAEETAALAQLDATKADYVAARLALSGQAARTWIAYAFSIEQIITIEEIIRLQQKMLAAITDAAQLSSRSDLVFAARSELLTTQNQLSQARAQSQQLEQALQTLISSDAKPNFSPATDWSENLQATSAKIDAQSIARRPDLIALEAQLRAAEARVDMAHANLYPRFSIGMAIGGSSDELGSLLDGDYRTWNFGANVLAPLFHGGALREQESAAQHQYTAASYSFGQHCIRAFAEVATLINNERALLEQASNLNELNALSLLQLRTKKDALSLGAGNVQNVLRAELAVKQGILNQINVDMFVMQNRVDLHLAVGGGFTQK